MCMDRSTNTKNIPNRQKQTEITKTNTNKKLHRGDRPTTHQQTLQLMDWICLRADLLKKHGKFKITYFYNSFFMDKFWLAFDLAFFGNILLPFFYLQFLLAILQILVWNFLYVLVHLYTKTAIDRHYGVKSKHCTQ